MHKGPGSISRRRFMAGAGVAAAYPLVLSPGKAAPADAGAYKAKIIVQPEHLHPLPKTQYGHFIEHLGRCIKGGLWAEGESDDMFMGGVRPELLHAVRSINPALIRYPGGCFADGYHWKDGIGPRSERPRRINRAWAKLGPLVGPLEDNHFGTDEFLGLCEAVGAEPMITVNVGSGTPAEAADWVQYTNGNKDTRWGAERAKNGHPEPYKVKYWFVGNEIFGWWEIGHMEPRRYVETFLEFAAAMRRVDPDIKLIPVGDHLHTGADINRTVLRGVGEEADLISVHKYVPPSTAANALRYGLANLHRSGLRSVYYQVMGTVAEAGACLHRAAKEASAYSPPGKKVPVAFDEWNLWFDYLDVIKANYSLRDGLWTASMLNVLHRLAPEAPVANIAQMVNCLGLISSSEKATFLTPSALAFKLYTERAGDRLLPSTVNCPELPHDAGIPALDASATIEGERLALLLVNRHYDSPAEVELTLEGMRPLLPARRLTITHPNPVQYNSARAPEAVAIREQPPGIEPMEQGALKGRAALRLPLGPHSITCIEMKVTRT